MPEKKSDQQALDWVHRMKKLILQSETLESSSLLQEQPVEVLSSGLEDLFDQVDDRSTALNTSTWPQVWQVDLKELLDKARELEKSNPRRASAHLRTLLAEIEARAVRIKELRRLMAEANGYLSASDHCAKELSSKYNPAPPDLKKLLDEYADERKKALEISKRFGAGDLDYIEKVGHDYRARMKRMHSGLERYEFRQHCVIDIAQGSFIRDGAHDTLLDEIQSEGVCLAMAMDWLGVGGSNGNPGDNRKGKISSSHLMGQHMIELEHNLNKREKKGMKLYAMLTGKRTAQELVEIAKGLKEQKVTVTRQFEEARDTLPKLRNQLAEAEQKVLNEEKDLKKAQDDLDTARKKGEDEFTIDFHEDNVRNARDWVDIAKKDRDELKEAVAEATRLVQELPGSLEELTQHIKDIEQERTDTIQGAGPLMRKLVDQQAAWEKLKEEWYAKVDPSWMLTSSLRKRTGVNPKEGTSTVVRAPDPAPDLGEDEDPPFLADKDVVDWFANRLDMAEKGVTTSISITVDFKKGGHALALRVTPPKKMDDPWDIEFMDPNAGAYRFDSRKTALDFVESFYKGFYQSRWCRLTGYEVTLPQGRDPDDVSSVGGISEKTAWTDDLAVLDPLYQAALSLRGLPRPVVEDLKAKRSRLDRLVPEEGATLVDIKLGRQYLNRLTIRCTQVDSELRAYTKARKDILKRLQGKDDDIQYDAAWTLVGRALRLFEDLGEMQSAARELGKAMSFVELLENQHRMVMEDEVKEEVVQL